MTTGALGGLERIFFAVDTRDALPEIAMARYATHQPSQLLQFRAHGRRVFERWAVADARRAAATAELDRRDLAYLGEAAVFTVYTTPVDTFYHGLTDLGTELTQVHTLGDDLDCPEEHIEEAILEHYGEAALQQGTQYLLILHVPETLAGAQAVTHEWFPLTEYFGVKNFLAAQHAAQEKASGTTALRSELGMLLSDVVSATARNDNAAFNVAKFNLFTFVRHVRGTEPMCRYAEEACDVMQRYQRSERPELALFSEHYLNLMVASYGNDRYAEARLRSLLCADAKEHL